MSGSGSRGAAWRHTAVVAVAFTVLFAWVYGPALGDRVYLVESDLYEYYLPLFLAPFVRWSSFEFAGLPVLADPGDAAAYPLFALFSKVVGSWSLYAVSAHVVGACGVYAYVCGATRSRRAAAFAGLSFGLSEAMVERVAHMQTLHAIAWIPWMFVTIDRLRDGQPSRWIGVGAAAIACGILAGHPQPTIYAGYAAIAYTLVSGRTEEASRRFYLVVAVTFGLGALLAATKLLPFAQVAGYLARQEMNFGQFVSRGNSPMQMWSVLFPTVSHDGREAPTYVGLLTLVLAAVGAMGARRHWRTAFWVGLVTVSVLLALGDRTPVARLFFDYVPAYDRFRVVSRHLALAALGCAVLAGVGLDAALRRQLPAWQIPACLVVLTGALAAGALTLSPPPAGLAVDPHPALPWAIWGAPRLFGDAVWNQLAIGALSIVAGLWLASGRALSACFAALLVIGAADALNAQPFAVGFDGVHAIVMPARAAEPSVHARAIRQELAPEGQRMLAMAGTDNDDVAPAAWSRIWRVPLAGGYGPMLLDRHAQLAGMGRDGGIVTRVLSGSDRGLDLLAVRDLLVQPRDTESTGTFQADGVMWERTPLDLAVGRDECGEHPYARSESLALPAEVAARSVELVLLMRCAEDVEQGTVVATVELRDVEGRVTRRDLRAGIDVAEGRIRDPQVGSRVRHRPAAAFDDPEGSGQARTHVSVAPPEPVRLSRLTVTTPSFRGWLVVGRVTVVGADGRAYPQRPADVFLRDESRWRVVRRFRTSRLTDREADEAGALEHDYTLYRNERALPRAWVVRVVRRMNEREVRDTIRTGQLPDGAPFDPRTVALIDEAEAGPSRTSFGDGERSVHVRAADNGFTELDVVSSGGGVLVLSESWYPGWTAWIDDTEAPVFRADLSLQGVELPPGRHRVRFVFAPPVLRLANGISVGALVAAVWLVRPRRRPAA